MPSKQIFSLLIWAMICTCPKDNVAAQHTKDSTFHALRAESWSIQFGINSNLTLRPFDGSTFSAKRHFSATRALRFGVTINSQFSNLDGVDETATDFFDDEFPTRINDTDIDQTRTILSLTLSAYFLRYVESGTPVHLFWGIGPRTSYTSSILNQEATETQNFVDDPPTLMTSDIERTTMDAGIHFLFGVEWFFSNHFSLTAEYGTSMLYRRTRDSRKTSLLDNRRDTFSERSSTENGFVVGNGGVLFGLSIYF